MRVKLTVKCKLDVPAEYLGPVDDTFSKYREACEYISWVAYETRTFGKVALHHATYYEVRKRAGLPAQLACTARDKVAEAYKRDKARRHRFKKDCVRLDGHTFRLMDGDRCSFTAVGGRVKAALVLGDYQRKLLSTWEKSASADLVRKRGTLYVHVVVYKDFDDPEAASDYLGVDLGIRNVVTTSDGEIVTGEVVDKVRTRYVKLRQRLQAKGTRSAKRHLKKLSGKEQRFQQDVNHKLSKRLVHEASESGRGLVIEDLTHIRKRTKVRKKQRYRHNSWAFAQLRDFLSYKCAIAGVPLAVVDPRNTSRTCSECGHCEKANRQGETFHCRSCGYTANSDVNGAKNIRVAVNRPIVEVGVDSDLRSTVYKPTAFAVGS